MNWRWLKQWIGSFSRWRWEIMILGNMGTILSLKELVKWGVSRATVFVQSLLMEQEVCHHSSITHCGGVYNLWSQSYKSVFTYFIRTFSLGEELSICYALQSQANCFHVCLSGLVNDALLDQLQNIFNAASLLTWKVEIMYLLVSVSNTQHRPGGWHVWLQKQVVAQFYENINPNDHNW